MPRFFDMKNLLHVIGELVRGGAFGLVDVDDAVLDKFFWRSFFWIFSKCSFCFFLDEELFHVCGKCAEGGTLYPFRKGVCSQKCNLFLEPQKCTAFFVEPT